MRICSLLPSATEIVYALGLGDALVGRSHACDYPEAAAALPVVSRSIRSVSHLSSAEIDAAIQQARASGNPLYWIDAELLRELRPELILTQELCEVCAIAGGSVFETAAQCLDYQPQILTIRPNTLGDILDNIENIAAAAGAPERGATLRQSLTARAGRVAGGLAELGANAAGDSNAARPANAIGNSNAAPPADAIGNSNAPAGAVPRRRVLCLDWLEPLRNTGQWIPELVELAGGAEGLALAGGRSRELAWPEITAYAPEFLMIMACAFDPERSRAETLSRLPHLPGWAELPAVQQGQVFIFDGRIPSRHGPRVVDVLEGLAEALYPQQFRHLAPPGVFAQLRITN